MREWSFFLSATGFRAALRQRLARVSAMTLPASGLPGSAARAPAAAPAAAPQQGAAGRLLIRRARRVVAPGLALLALGACQPAGVHRLPPDADAPHWEPLEGSAAALAGEMTFIPGGTFLMGNADDADASRERPAHRVTAPAFIAGKREVTVGQFRRFAEATGYLTEAERDVLFQGCFDSGMEKITPGRSWRDPGYPIEDDRPVTCVSWNDAQAFIAWITEQTGRQFRLLTEAEWEYAARAGNAATYYFGNRARRLCRHANVMDRSRAAHGRMSKGWENPAVRCDDGAFFPTTTGSYPPNGFGLHDMYGNAGEWVQDCWNDNYEGAPGDGGAWEIGDCRVRIIRGGGYSSLLPYVNSTGRSPLIDQGRTDALGFRLARDLEPGEGGAATQAP